MHIGWVLFVNVVTSDLKLSTEDVLNSGDEDEQIFVNVRDKRPVSSQTMSASNISDVRTGLTFAHYVSAVCSLTLLCYPILLQPW